jgi:hypothetical protein
MARLLHMRLEMIGILDNKVLGNFKIELEHILSRNIKLNI